MQIKEKEKNYQYQTLMEGYHRPDIKKVTRKYVHKFEQPGWDIQISWKMQFTTTDRKNRNWIGLNWIVKDLHLRKIPACYQFFCPDLSEESYLWQL